MSSVKKVNTGPRKVVRENPLIPTSLLDTAQQRLVVIAFFVLVQSFKVYDLIILKNSDTQGKLTSPQVINTLFIVSFHDNRLNFLFKYLTIDCLFIWFLPFLNIPLMNFSKIVTAIQIIMIAVLDVSLANESSIPVFSSILAVIAKLVNGSPKELSLLGDIVDTSEILDHSQYFKGKKVIKFLPDSSVELNPFANNWCIDTDLVQVPIKFNTSSTGLDFLQLKYINLEDNSTELLNYTGKHLKKLMKDGAKSYYNEVSSQDNIFYIDIPLPESGYYQINRVIDNKAMNLKVLNRHLILPQCPTAKFIGTSSKLKRACLNDVVQNDELIINAVGLPPLIVTYSEEINGVLADVPRRRLIPKDLKTPLSNSKNISSKDISTLSSWASLRSINLPVFHTAKLEKAGDYIYTVKSIEDALGNKISYEAPSAENQLLYKFITHSLPFGQLVDHSSSRPLLEGGSKKVNIQLSGIPCQKCDSPYTAEINQYNENHEFVKTFNQTYDLSVSRDLSFSVGDPGFYELNQLHSNFCSTGKTNEIHIPFVEKPKVSIVADPIVDACVGTMGFKFKFNVVGGTPPFRLEYRVNRLKNNRAVSVPALKAIEAKSRVFEHDYRPAVEGNYSIEFIKMKDHYYGETFDSERYKYITYFKQKPKAEVLAEAINVCYGKSAKFSVGFEGVAPYSLKYNLLKRDKVIKTFEEENITDNEHVIQTPSFNEGGPFVLQLLEAKDASHCNVELKRSKVFIHVRDNISKVAFSKTQKVSIVQGTSQKIPLNYNGPDRSTVDIKYRFSDSEGNESIRILKSVDPKGGFPVDQKGTYLLLELNDGGCDGVVGGETITVEYITKPLISLQKGSIHAVCVDKGHQFKFALKGKAPFSIEYSIQHPNKKIENRFERVDTDEFTLKAITSKSGDYKYSIDGVHDALYTGDILERLSRQGLYKFQTIELEHTVWDTPGAVFSNATSSKSMNSHQNLFVQMCSSNLNDEKRWEPIPIQLFGKPPFNLRLSLDSIDGNFRKTFQLSNIDTDYIESYDIYKNFKLDIGSYTMSLLSIEDANGCSNKNLKEESNNVALKINDIPKIKRQINKFVEHNKVDLAAFARHKINKGFDYDDYYCVGDHIFFALEGLQPFSINYRFNEEAHSIKDLNVPNFKRLATMPGELIIDSLTDFSAKNCIVDLKEKAEKIMIYELPSVEIFQGNAVEEDIHAGDQVELLFTFKGIPPFRLTYTRTTIDDGRDQKKKKKGKKHGNKVIETEVVENIPGYEYRVWTSLEGTYEAIEVEDSRCRVKNYV